MHLRLACIVAICLSAAPAWAIDVDGRIDAAEWQGAEHVTDFRLVEPLSRAPSPYPKPRPCAASATAPRRPTPSRRRRGSESLMRPRVRLKVQARSASFEDDTCVRHVSALGTWNYFVPLHG